MSKKKSGMQIYTKQDKAILYCGYALLALFLIAIIVPMVYIVIASFMDPVTLQNKGISFDFSKWSLDAYERVISDKQIWVGFKNAVLYSVIFTVISVAVTMLAAYPMSLPDFKGKKFFNTLFVITMFFNGGLIPTYLLINNIGLLDSMWAVILPGAFSVWNMIIARTYYQGIPRELREAADVDGASEMRYFFNILLPVCMPVVAVLALWQFVAMWNSYFDAMIYLNSSSKQPLQFVLRSILIQSQPESGMIADIQSTAERAKMAELLFTADFSDSDLLRYADQGVIVNLEDYIDNNMPNLKKVFEMYPEYRTMCTDSEGHIWALPWIEQLGAEKTAIQTVGNMSFINKKWLDFLGLEMPTTVDEFEQVLIAFRDNADAIKSEFGIEGDIIPMSCIVNNGDQDPSILINGFGEGYGDADKDRHIAVTDDLKVICAATQQGYREGLDWLHKLYSENLIDPECFTQEWSTYVSKGKAGRYGVCFSWDVANIDNLTDWEPLPALTADTRNITPQNGSFTSGFGRGKCVVTSKASNPALVCAWLDQMDAALQSHQNNWGTYGDETGFNIFEMSTNDKGEPMLKHAPLGDASPVEVREAQCVGGPLAVLDDYYGVYVTCPDDAQYRLDWIKDIYTPDMNKKYVYPNVFMSTEDTEQVSNLQADLQTYMNTQKANWIMNGTTDAEWNEYLDKLEAYGLSDYLAIMQKYLDAYYAKQ